MSRRQAIPALTAALLVALTGLGAAPARAAAASGDTRDLAALVNPLAGSAGPGFPMVAASRPFGMMQAGPNTGLPGTEDQVNYDGYSYADTTVRGFGLTHFDGAGIHIAGDLPFLPTTGPVTSTDPNVIASPFTHAAETAQPGYYSVMLSRYATQVELTATERAAMVRMTFPAAAQANVLFDVSRSVTGLHPAGVAVVDDHTVAGFARSAAAPEGYLVWFTATLDHRIIATGTWSGSTLTPGASGTSGSANGVWVTLDTTASPVVTMRTALSYVDAAGASANLRTELPATLGFDGLRQAAHDAWNARLHDVEVQGGEGDQLATFYTSLFRSLLMPSLFDDVDGRYLGFDRVPHRVGAGHHHYTNLSLWDTYRTQNPLLELIEPAVDRDVLLSLLDDYDQNHKAIPRWTQANLDYGIMGGDSGSAYLADGVARGLLRGDDAHRAAAALLHQATTLPPLFPREHLDAYLSHGYVGNDVSGIGTAVTQEYSIDDHAVAQVLRRTGNLPAATTMERRAASWRNVLDPSSAYIRPRNSDGSWANPTAAGPVSVPWSPDFQDGYQEGTGWQYLWLEPHDVAGLVAAIGGPAVAISRLDSFFSEALTGVPYVVPVTQQQASFFGIYYIGDQYTPANEPDLQVGWYYDWLGQPWKTQQVVRAAMQTYNSQPTGLPGNDDTGTMSAWYVLAAIGLYGVSPGMPVMELTTPAFSQVVLHLGSADRAFTITATGASSQMVFAQSALRDGATFDRTYLTQCDIHPGGHLDWTLGSAAGTWGTSAGAAPPSQSDGHTPSAVSACEQTLSDAAATGPGGGAEAIPAAAGLPDTAAPVAGTAVAAVLLVLVGPLRWSRGRRRGGLAG